jgi:hypothetical protein
MMAELPLSNGGVTLVDDDMLESLSRFSWFKHQTGYVRGYVPVRFGGRGRHTVMARWIMRAPNGMVVDHINGNPLDNRRENLQIVTTSRNIMKGKLAMRGGVCYLKDRDRWIAKIRVDGTRYYIGAFLTREQAQAALDLYRHVAWAAPEVNTLGAVRTPDERPVS